MCNWKCQDHSKCGCTKLPTNICIDHSKCSIVDYGWDVPSLGQSLKDGIIKTVCVATKELDKLECECDGLCLLLFVSYDSKTKKYKVKDSKDNEFLIDEGSIVCHNNE